jgi:hypothetical protein
LTLIGPAEVCVRAAICVNLSCLNGMWRLPRWLGILEGAACSPNTTDTSSVEVDDDEVTLFAGMRIPTAAMISEVLLEWRLGDAGRQADERSRTGWTQIRQVCK